MMLTTALCKIHRIILLLMCLLIFSRVAMAADSELEENRIRLACALSSMAAYSDDNGNIAGKFLEGHGWRINDLASPSKTINVKMHVMTRADNDSNFTKIFYFTGTEDKKDISVDIKLKKVPFGDDDKILVHSGFKEYADAAISGGILDFVVEYIDNHPNEDYYITGHSLGGAVAILVGARLVDAGADMSKVRIVTFGAPAVGNREFADAYKDKINMTRIAISGDPIDKALGVLGYIHLCDPIKYKEVESPNHYAHSMALYLDCAIRNYYNSGGFESLINILPKYKIDTPIYIAPVQSIQNSFNKRDLNYVKSILRDGYLARFNNATFDDKNFIEVKKADDFSYSVREYLEPARKSGCKFILIPFLQVKPIQDAKRLTYRVSVEENLYDTKGTLLTMSTSALSTLDLTLLEATIFAQENLREEREKFIVEN